MKMNSEQTIAQLNHMLVVEKFEALNDKEIAVLQAAFTNLSGPKDKRGQADPFTPYGDLENSGTGKFALDANAFQVIRCKNPTTASFGESWLRYGLKVYQEQGEEIIKPFVRKSMYRFSDKKVDPNVDLPASAAHLNSLYARGQRVVAFLGVARIKIEAGMLLIEHVQKLVDALQDVAIMTGGYRGEEGNSYGITRAGFDVPKSRGLQTMIVMCEAGLGHAHQTATSRSIYGENWGDDTPGLTEISDFGVFFRNVPPGKNYGAWTEVEVANFLYRNKGVAIFDPTLSTHDFPEGKKSETYFEREIPVFRDPVLLAQYIMKMLPSTEEIKKRPVFQPETNPDKISTFNLPFQKDLLYEDWMAVRLNYQRSEEEKIIEDEMKALWVKNDRSVFTNVDKNFKFTNAPGAYEEGRDLILSGYYKDIMLLQLLGKLKADDSLENLIKGYGQIRSMMEKTFQTEDPKDMTMHRKWYSRNMIGDIWFLYTAEHVPGFLGWLKNMPLDAYDKKLMLN